MRKTRVSCPCALRTMVKHGDNNVIQVWEVSPREDSDFVFRKRQFRRISVGTGGPKMKRAAVMHNANN